MARKGHGCVDESDLSDPHEALSAALARAPACPQSAKRLINHWAAVNFRHQNNRNLLPWLWRIPAAGRCCVRALLQHR